jgi:Mn-dependent DtxR family transcriptional regulator
MLKRLSDEGLVDYEPYHGARLTTKGERWRSRRSVITG